MVVGPRHTAHNRQLLAEKPDQTIAKVLGPEPVGASELVGIEVARHYVREPLA